MVELFRDILGSPMLAVGQSGMHAALPPPPSATATEPTPTNAAAAPGEKRAGWLSFLSSSSSAKSESDEAALRKQVREYEQRLTDMRSLASKQAHDIASLRAVAERTLHEQVSKGVVRDEQRWKQLMQEASSTQEQALAQVREKQQLAHTRALSRS